MPSTEKNRCLTRFSVSPTYRQSSGAPPAVKKGATPSPIEHHPLTITPDTRLDNLSKRHISLTGRMPGLSPFTATTSCGSALMRLDMPQFLASPLDNDPPSPPSCAPSVPALQNVSPPVTQIKKRQFVLLKSPKHLQPNKKHTLTAILLQQGTGKNCTTVIVAVIVVLPSRVACSNHCYCKSSKKSYQASFQLIHHHTPAHRHLF
eukprot:Platyproteum_vivax@DN8786_c0_g1_i1.p1